MKKINYALALGAKMVQLKRKSVNLWSFKMPTVPTYDLPQSPILIVGFFGILFTLVLLYFVNRAYFESPLNRDKKS